MSKYSVKRDGALDLSICGQMIADASGRKGDSKKWTEIRIFKTDQGRYVLARDRISELAGESNFHEAEVFEDVQDLIQALKDDKGQLGRLSKLALEEAATHDATIQTILDADDLGEPVRCFLEYANGDFMQEILREPLPERITRRRLSHSLAMQMVEPGVEITPQKAPHYVDVTLELHRPKEGTGFAKYVEVKE